MIGLDWIILALVLVLALYGWAQGFVTGVLSLAGFVAGAVLGSRLAPLVLSEGAESPYAPLLGLAGALVVGAVLAAGLGGVGARLRGRLRAPGVAAADGLLGAVLVAAVGLGVVWILGAVALQTPGAQELRTDIQRSVILSRLNGILPPSGPLLNALARFDPFPAISGPEADVAPPRGSIASDPEVENASASVVRILGVACGLGVQGSGWVAAPELVVTNAHVVAGQDEPDVLPEGRAPGLDARVVHFDPRNDLAVLRVPGLRAAALPLAPEPRRGTAAAVLGFPRNGPYRVRPGRLGRTARVVSQDAYGNGPVTRVMTALRGRVRPGNSGGPMVDGRGQVVTTVFAETTSGPAGGYGVPNAIVAEALRDTGREVSPGPCTR